MSWGERSCKKPCRIMGEITPLTCTVDCIGYIHDGITEPDTTSIVPKQPNREQRRNMKK